ncbi:outer membrane homotrimeric porin [Desulfocurvus sp. DL9XJH121]
MKRLLILAVAVCVVFGASLANAKEMKFKGQFDQHLEWANNANFFGQGDDANDGDRTSEDDFNARQRVRMYFEYVDSENLRGVVGFEIDTRWGDAAGGGSLGTDGKVVEVKHAYVDYKVGGVSIRSGLQSLGFPSAAMGSPIWNNDVAGIIANYKFNDMVSVVAGWTRLWDTNASDAGSAASNDEIDAFTVMAPITAEGWSLTPYVVYATAGKDTYDAVAVNKNKPINSLLSADTARWADDLDIWWAGGAFKLDMFDPFTLGVDLIYGSVDGDTNEVNDRAGWFFATELDYKMDVVTPGLLFFYGTGDDDDPKDGSEAMPTLAGGANSGFAATKIGFHGGHWGSTYGQLVSNYGNFGMWGIGLTLKNFSLCENLKQTFTVLYGKGTNDADGIKGRVVPAGFLYGFSDKDSFWDVELYTDYALYENLTLWSEMAYINVDADEDTWKTTLARADETSAFSKIAVGIRYNF